MNKKGMTYNQFLEQGGEGVISPLSREIHDDLDTPLSCYTKMRDAYPASPSFLLEGVDVSGRTRRFSFIGFEPLITFRSMGGKVSLEGVVEDGFESDNPFLNLREILKKIETLDFPDTVARFGGAAGYMGYGMASFFEGMPLIKERNIGVYDMHFIFPGKLVLFDKYTGKITLFLFHYAKGGSGEDHAEAVAELDELEAIVRSSPVVHKKGGFSPRMKGGDTTREEFYEMVSQAKAYIDAGEVSQVVLSRRLVMEISADSLSLYRALCAVNPSPYMFLLDYMDYSLIGASPETLVRLNNGEIEVRPIAGTRKRGKDGEEDDLLAKELLSDKKELAEHAMLVDLGKTDVGRVAETGSVTVPESMDIEKYSHVMHIVSSVKGKVKDGMDAFHVLRSVFPAGTVTGAPKKRAMEIIDELEREKREFYGGGVGYFAFNGDMDFCITIRTMLKKGNDVYIQAGAGIVADSAPEKEYMETTRKAQALVESIMGLEGLDGGH